MNASMVIGAGITAAGFGLVAYVKPIVQAEYQTRSRRWARRILGLEECEQRPTTVGDLAAAVHTHMKPKLDAMQVRIGATATSEQVKRLADELEALKGLLAAGPAKNGGKEDWRKDLKMIAIASELDGALHNLDRCLHKDARKKRVAAIMDDHAVPGITVEKLLPKLLERK